MVSLSPACPPGASEGVGHKSTGLASRQAHLTQPGLISVPWSMQFCAMEYAGHFCAISGLISVPWSMQFCAMEYAARIPVPPVTGREAGACHGSVEAQHVRPAEDLQRGARTVKPYLQRRQQPHALSLAATCTRKAKPAMRTPGAGRGALCVRTSGRRPVRARASGREGCRRGLARCGH